MKISYQVHSGTFVSVGHQSSRSSVHHSDRKYPVMIDIIKFSSSLTICSNSRIFLRGIFWRAAFMFRLVNYSSESYANTSDNRIQYSSTSFCCLQINSTSIYKIAFSLPNLPFLFSKNRCTLIQIKEPNKYCAQLLMQVRGSFRINISYHNFIHNSHRVHH